MVPQKPNHNSTDTLNTNIHTDYKDKCKMVTEKQTYTWLIKRKCSINNFDFVSDSCWEVKAYDTRQIFSGNMSVTLSALLSIFPQQIHIQIPPISSPPAQAPAKFTVSGGLQYSTMHP